VSVTERENKNEFPNYELARKKSCIKIGQKGKETEKSLIPLCVFTLHTKLFFQLIFPVLRPNSNQRLRGLRKKVFNVYLHVVGYIFRTKKKAAENCDAEAEREGPKKLYFSLVSFYFSFLSCPKKITTQNFYIVVYVCAQNFSTMHYIHKYSSKKNAFFAPRQKNNINSNASNNNM
jgi:hypothetical protein